MSPVSPRDQLYLKSKKINKKKEGERKEIKCIIRNRIENIRYNLNTKRMFI